MSIMDKYELTSMVGAGEANAFRAHEISTGRSVLVHQFSRAEPAPDETDLMSMVCKYLGRADAPGIENFLDSTEEDDRVFIVTSDLPECLNLRQWLNSIALALGEVPAVAAPAAEGEGSVELREPPHRPAVTPAEREEYSQMLNAEPSGPAQPGAPPLESYAPTVVISVKPPASPGPAKVGQPHATSAGPSFATSPAQPPHAPAETDAAEPGEFTKMFNTSRAPQQPARSIPSVPPASHQEKEPGEFTIMFNASGQRQTKPQAPGSAANNQPTPTAEVGGQVHPQPPPTFPRGQQESRPPGEFTQMFKTGGEPPRRPSNISSPASSIPLSSSSKQGPGEFTMLIQGQNPTAAPPPPAVLETPKPASPAPAADASQKGPGEFTMLFRRPAQPAVPAATPPVAPPPAARPTPPPPAVPSSGEYTAMFEAPRAPSGAPVPTQAPSAGYRYPAAPPVPSFQPPAPQIPAAPAPQYPAPPAYAAPKPAFPQAPPPLAAPPLPQPAPPAATKKPPIFWILLLALGCLFLTAVVLVLLVALKH